MRPRYARDRSQHESTPGTDRNTNVGPRLIAIPLLGPGTLGADRNTLPNQGTSGSDSSTPTGPRYVWGRPQHSYQTKVRLGQIATLPQGQGTSRADRNTPTGPRYVLGRQQHSNRAKVSLGQTATVIQGQGMCLGQTATLIQGQGMSGTDSNMKVCLGQTRILR